MVNLKRDVMADIFEDALHEGDNGTGVGFGSGSGERFVTRAEVLEIVQEAIAGLRIYVLESDITGAQERVKTIVEQASF